MLPSMSQIPGIGGQLRSKVEFYVSCRGLVNMDLLSKSDPFCVVYYRDTKTGVWSEMGRTETIMDNLNPDFTQQFVTDYFFEEVQVLRFDVYDLDSESSNLKDHDFIGTFETTLGHIMGSRGQTASGELVLTNPNSGVVGSAGAPQRGGGAGAPGGGA